MIKQILVTLATGLLLCQLGNACFWIFKGKAPKIDHPIRFTACVFNKSADFDCIGDCVYYAVKHGLELCYCYYRDCNNRNRTFSFTVSANANPYPGALVDVNRGRSAYNSGYLQTKQRKTPKVFEGGDCRNVYTYDPKNEDNIRDRKWLKRDPYSASGEICLNGYPAVVEPERKSEHVQHGDDHELATPLDAESLYRMMMD